VRWPVSLSPLGPTLGCADADAGQVSEDRSRKLSSQREAGGVAPGMGVDAMAVETDAKEDVHGRTVGALTGEEPWHRGPWAAECPPRLVLVAPSGYAAGVVTRAPGCSSNRASISRSVRPRSAPATVSTSRAASSSSPGTELIRQAVTRSRDSSSGLAAVTTGQGSGSCCDAPAMLPGRGSPAAFRACWLTISITIRSLGWHSRMSHNAASASVDRRWGNLGHQPIDLLTGQAGDHSLLHLAQH
jgi:hypothetical protein